jgi:hypothetical protein
MPLVAAVGYAQALDAREAGLQAAHQALNRLGSTSPAMAIVISPYRFEPNMVISGVASLMSNIPILGFSTVAGLTRAGRHSHAVVVALLGGEGLQAETHWFSAYSQASAESAIRIQQLLGYEQRPAQAVLVFGDGLNGSADEFCQNLPANMPILGGLASGDPQNNAGYQFAGAQSGANGMAAAFLRGKMKMGIGYGHGWSPVGNHFRVTRSRGFWLRTLDGRPASETYASLFGYPAREWAFPPLNYMTRIYPLGFEQPNTPDLAVRSPLRVEADGSFRMNAPLRDGMDAYLMMGSPANCEAAAKQAIQQAMLSLEGAKPVLALLLVDSAWNMLLQARSGAELRAVQEIIGPDVPLAGGYTLGQIVPARPGDDHPQFLNQHMVVAVFAEPQE